MLAFLSLLQAHKTHPKDWENPGRVKTEYLKDGEPINPQITNRASASACHRCPALPSRPGLTRAPAVCSSAPPPGKQLYLAVSEQMHKLGTSVPGPRPTAATPKAAKPPAAAPSSSSTKGANASKAKGGGAPVRRPARKAHAHPTRAPKPPTPLPSLARRLPELSPALAGGHFLDVLKGEWKREQEAKASAPAVSGAGPAADDKGRIEDGPAGAGKEKKDKKPKVKMVRGGKR